MNELRFDRSSSRLLPVIASAMAVSCSASSTASHSDDIEALLQMHQAVLLAHRQADVDTWLDLEADEYVVANRGEITFPTKADRRAARENYLGSARFTKYADLRDPIVTVSNDRTLGWVIAQVGASGVRATGDGVEEPIEFVAAWIELYRKEGDEWRLVGNVSNVR